MCHQPQLSPGTLALAGVMGVKMLSAGRWHSVESWSATCVGRTSGEEMEKPGALPAPPGEGMGKVLAQLWRICCSFPSSLPMRGWNKYLERCPHLPSPGHALQLYWRDFIRRDYTEPLLCPRLAADLQLPLHYPEPIFHLKDVPTLPPVNNCQGLSEKIHPGAQSIGWDGEECWPFRNTMGPAPFFFFSF